MTIIPIILSGGSGLRLWPLSRKQLPKQYLKLSGKKTMLQETILRLRGIDNITKPFIICNDEHRFLVAQQCQEINLKDSTLILEPVARNTAPAIAAGALLSLTKHKDALLLVLSADHVIKNVKAFHAAIKIASQQAQKNNIITFGIVPSHANTAFGYIKSLKNKLNEKNKVEQFIEKPNQKTADTFLKQGNYLWNSGIFMFKASKLINELTTHAPKIITQVKKAVENSKKDLDFVRLDKESFQSSPSISIDYALLEKSKNVFVILLDAGWSDVGSWSALYDISSKDSNGNVFKGDVISLDTTDTYINSQNRLIAAIGVNKLIIVDTPDATLITSLNKEKEIKSFVKSLHDKQKYQGDSNLKVYRPWGWYHIIETGKNFQIKKLNVKPKSKLSLQFHNKRSEHWLVINGIATVINGDDIHTLTKGKSTYIPSGVNHSLENKTNKILEIIEIQYGSYLGEDDIVRLEDIYGRI